MKDDNAHGSTRRTFLRRLGGAGLALPLLPALLRGSSATAQPVAPPKRLVCLFTHNQQLRAPWMPTGTDRDFTLSPVLAPLAPFQDRMLVLHNMASTFNDHPASTSAWSESNGNGPSIDQVVAQRLGNATRLRSLELGVQTETSVSFGGPRLRVPAIAHPIAAYDRVMNAAQNDPAERARQASQTGSVLAATRARFERLRGRLSASETRLVDAQISELTDLEDRVRNPAEVRACAIPPPPAVPTGSTTLRDQTLFPAVCQAHLDNIATALTCDVTRVASLMIGGSGSTVTYSWLGISDVAHDVAHGFRNASGATIANAEDQWASIQTWHAQQIADFVAKLDSVVEDDGTTVLDNTIVLWASELGLANGGGHQRNNVPAVIVGGGGGALDTGRFLDLGGRPYADLLLTLGHAMGYTDMTSFGADGTRPVAEILA